MDNPFRFRGQRKDNGEWVVGWYRGQPDCGCIMQEKDGYWCFIKPESLSISTGKLDSTGTEIFASFPIDGVMTEGGDALEDFGEYPFPVIYSKDHCGFILTSEGEYWSMLGDYRENALTIIGRGGGNLPAALNLARQDEREKITEEKVKDYFAGLSGKETALIVLNYLLRGGITDDDLRGLRLQWIKDDFCKCDSPDREAGYTYCHKCHKHVSDERFEQLTTEAT